MSGAISQLTMPRPILPAPPPLLRQAMVQLIPPPALDRLPPQQAADPGPGSLPRLLAQSLPQHPQAWLLLQQLQEKSLLILSPTMLNGAIFLCTPSRILPPQPHQAVSSQHRCWAAQAASHMVHLRSSRVCQQAVPRLLLPALSRQVSLNGVMSLGLMDHGKISHMGALRSARSAQRQQSPELFMLMSLLPSQLRLPIQRRQWLPSPPQPQQALPPVQPMPRPARVLPSMLLLHQCGVMRLGMMLLPRHTLSQPSTPPQAPHTAHLRPLPTSLARRQSRQLLQVLSTAHPRLPPMSPVHSPLLQLSQPVRTRLLSMLCQHRLKFGVITGRISLKLIPLPPQHPSRPTTPALPPHKSSRQPLRFTSGQNIPFPLRQALWCPPTPRLRVL